MATSVPAPIAMPTSALASAGASLTPSPASVLELGDLGVLVFGKYFSEDLIDSQLLGDTVSDLSGVTGDQHHLHAALVEGVDSDLGLRTDLIGQGQGSDYYGVLEHIEHRATLFAPLFGRCPQIFGFGDAESCEQGGATHGDQVTVDSSLHAAPGEGG